MVARPRARRQERTFRASLTGMSLDDETSSDQPTVVTVRVELGRDPDGPPDVYELSHVSPWPLMLEDEAISSALQRGLEALLEQLGWQGPPWPS